MKKKGLSAVVLSIVLILCCAVVLTGCFFDDDDTPSTPPEPKTYTIQYTDDAGTHTINVTEDMPYSITAVPSKTGYTFLGLFDAETGGTQYVSASGASLAPFTDGKNMVLFPQFAAKEYTVILDWQGAAVTGARQVTVSYGTSLPALPTNPTLAHKEFVGWFTAPDCGGVKVADKYGLVPVVSVLNGDNFDLRTENITLYAGFEIEQVTVTCVFGNGLPNEQCMVDYDTPIAKFVPKTRKDNNAPLTWSKSDGGTAFIGNITETTVLYALEWAPVLELDPNGGKGVNPVVARAGATIELPTPTRDLYKFLHWETLSGTKYTSTTMPSTSTPLRAVWQAKIVFDSNGGNAVDDISLAAGATVTLPTPERENYIFAGWYTADKEEYTSKLMPSVGTKLKAGWYAEKTETVVLSNKDDYMYDYASVEHMVYPISCKKYMNGTESINIKIDWHVKVSASDSYHYTFKVYCAFYSQRLVSTSCFMYTETISDVTNLWKEVTFTTKFTVKDDFFAMWYTNKDNTKRLYVRDYYYTIHYPDTTSLYL